MKKAIIFLLMASLIMSLMSCDFLNENPLTSTGNEDSTASTTTETTTTTNNQITEYSATHDGRFYQSLTLEKYEELLQNGVFPDFLISYEQVSVLGGFDSIAGASWTEDFQYERYVYTFDNNLKLMINHRMGDASLLYLVDYMIENHSNIKRLEEHSEDDFRYCTDMDDTWVYTENDITYAYSGGPLEAVLWESNGVEFCLYFMGGLKDHQWRTWSSLFLHRESADRAIEFFDLMIEGELPTIDEVFGEAYDAEGNPINRTPCEITWQKTK